MEVPLDDGAERRRGVRVGLHDLRLGHRPAGDDRRVHHRPQRPRQQRGRVQEARSREALVPGRCCGRRRGVPDHVLLHGRGRVGLRVRVQVADRNVRAGHLGADRGPLQLLRRQRRRSPDLAVDRAGRYQRHHHRRCHQGHRAHDQDPAADPVRPAVDLRHPRPDAARARSRRRSTCSGRISQDHARR